MVRGKVQELIGGEGGVPLLAVLDKVVTESKFLGGEMKVLDDGCICEFCPKSKEEKKKCEFFLLTTGLQRVAEAAMINQKGFVVRIEMAECLTLQKLKLEKQS